MIFKSEYFSVFVQFYATQINYFKENRTGNKRKMLTFDFVIMNIYKTIIELFSYKKYIEN